MLPYNAVKLTFPNASSEIIISQIKQCLTFASGSVGSSLQAISKLFCSTSLRTLEVCGPITKGSSFSRSVSIFRHTLANFNMRSPFSSSNSSS